MPRLQDLKEFKRDLDALAHEDEILARWGEEREDPPLPEGGAEEAAKAPAKRRAPSAGAAARPTPKKAARAEAAAPDEGLPPDFATLLGELPLDSPSSADGLVDVDSAERPADSEDATDAEALDELDLESLLAPGLADDTPPSADVPLDPSLDTLATDEEPAIDEDFSSLPGMSAPGAEVPEAPEAAFPGAGLVDEIPRAAPFSMADTGFDDTGTADTEGLPGIDDLGDLAADGPSPEEQAPIEMTSPEAPESFSLGDEAFNDSFLSEEPGAVGGATDDASAREGLAEGATESLADGAADGLGDIADGFGDLSDSATGGLADSSASAPEVAAEAGATGSLDDFTMPDFGEPDSGSPEPMADSSPQTGGESPVDDFSIPDFGGPEPAAAAEPTEQKAGSSLDDFSLPDSGGLGEASTATKDAFEGFSLDDATFGSSSLGGDGFGPSGPDLDSQLAALGDEVSPAATFNLDKDWGAGFEVPGGADESAAKSAAGGRKPAEKERPQSQPSEKVRPVSLTEDQVDKLQDRLLAFPLNLRLAVEDSISNEKGTEAQRSKLVWMLVEHASFEDVAALVSRVQKRRITVPDGYEKSTGADFQAEQGSFRYTFRHTILPILKTALLVLAAAGVLLFLGYKFIYRPLAADALYRSGYARIGQDRYLEAEDSFRRAGKLHEYVVWYYRYAEAYAAKRQYAMAEAKYSGLLAAHPKEFKGALAWAKLEKDLLKYKEAVDILDKYILEVDYHNKDALLLLGDVYLEWGDEVPAHYEDARISYATLIQNFGMTDLYLERMLLYFMRVDKVKEVIPLKNHFMSAQKVFLDAPTLAELGGYLLDKGMLEDVHPILELAVKKDKTVPEAHYELARYFHKADSPGEEMKALDNSIALFGKLPLLGSRQEAMYVDSFLRRADLALASREYIAAEADYSAAASEYARGVDLGRITRAPRFAAAYAGLGEVAYWQRDDLAAALTWFERAAADGYDRPGIRYERGAILYRQQRTKDALEQFFEAGKGGSESPYLLYAFGNALYAREDFHAAEGYYRRTVAAMQAELEQLSLPAPGEKASHAEIVELLMEAQNNLGASTYRVGTRIGDARLRAEANADFAESTRLYDSLVRDQATLVRAGASNLGLANMNFLLNPKKGGEPALYTGVERGMDFPRK